MTNKLTFYVCPQCGWSSRIRYNKETEVMVCGHCPYEGAKEDFEQEEPEPTPAENT